MLTFYSATEMIRARLFFCVIQQLCLTTETILVALCSTYPSYICNWLFRVCSSCLFKTARITDVCSCKTCFQYIYAHLLIMKEILWLANVLSSGFLESQIGALFYFHLSVRLTKIFLKLLTEASAYVVVQWFSYWCSFINF